MIFSSRRYIGQYVRLCRNFYRILWALNNLFLCGDLLILRGRFFEKFIGMKNSQRKKSLCTAEFLLLPYLRSENVCVARFKMAHFKIYERGQKPEFLSVCVVVHFTCFLGGPANGVKRVDNLRNHFQTSSMFHVSQPRSNRFDFKNILNFRVAEDIFLQ